MFKKTLISFLILLFIAPYANSAVSNRYKGKYKKGFKNKDKKERVIKSEVGLNIPEWGLAIDAIFDPRLSELIPGYHIVNLVITNKRGEPIMFDTRNDRWTIVDHVGKRHTAHNHVKQFNRKLWPNLPKKLQAMLEYPHKVSPGRSITIDVFIPKSVDLINFKEVVWKSAHFGKEFNLFTNYEDNLKLPASKEFDTPKVNKANQEDFLNDQLAPETVIAPKLETVEDSVTNEPPAKIGEIIDITPNTTKEKEGNTVDGFIRLK